MAIEKKDMNKELKDKLSKLSPDQLKKLIKQLGNEKKALPHMDRNEAQVYPVTSAQKRMWFLSKLDPESYLYTNPIGIRVKSKQEIDMDLYAHGFVEMTQRHEILRTSFFSENGRIYQKVHNKVPFKIDKIDLTTLAEEERMPMVMEILAKDGKTTIHVDDFPLIRFKLLKLSRLEFVLIYTSHHIISDAWSSSHLFREMQMLFEKRRAHAAAELAPVKYQFVDYVLWEQNWLESENFQKTANKWKELVPYSPEPLNFILDYQRPPVIDYSGALVKKKLDKKLVSELEQFNKEAGVNMFNTLLAAFNVLLHKYSRNEEIVVGIPLANRKVREFQQTVGMFLNTLPHRSNVKEGITFMEYLQQVKQISQDLIVHQDYPFEKLIEELNPPRNLSISPLFQVLFVFQNIPSMYDWEDLEVGPVKSDYNISKFDLDIWIEEVAGELQLSLTYQTSLFDKTTAEKLLAQYEFLLENILNHSNQVISDLAIDEAIKVKVPEQQDLGYTSYLEAFEKHAANNGDRLALQFQELPYSYKVLNQKANQLGHYLNKQNNPDTPVIAFALDRHPDQLISLLAINKTGAAYLPIEPNNTQKQLEYILADAGIELLITSSKYIEKFRHLNLQIIVLDEEAASIEALPDTNLETQISSDSLAYLMYTSGSTGMPKGVCIEHDQLLNYALAVWERFDLEEQSIFGSVSAITTDLGNTQIFPAWINGAALNFIAEEYITNPHLLRSYFDEYPVDCLKIVPSHLKSLMVIEDKAGLLPEKLLITGGEKLSLDLIQQVRAARPNLRIINHYGPTETTIGILTHELEDVQSNSIIPIGKPLQNNEVYIVDAKNRLLPDGLPGEILVLGRNVGRGYWNKPTLNQQVFLSNFGGQPYRAYKTGDLGVKRADGSIAFLGRVDHQQKIRGYRVDLEAIEFVLQEVNGILQACAVSKNENDLAVFFVPEGDAEPAIHALKKHLENTLPSYMIPSHIVRLDQFPRLGNGKINRQDLKNFTFEPSGAAEPLHQGPRDEIELALVQIWKEVIKRPSIGIDDNFFQHGGNSLMAIELIARINDHFGANLGIGVLFESNTIKTLAQLLRDNEFALANSPIVLLKKGNSDVNVFLVHPAGGDILSYYELAQGLDANFNVYGLQTTVLDEDDPSIRTMAYRYLEAVLDRVPTGTYVFGGWSMGALVAFDMAILLKEERGDLAQVLILDQKAPNDSPTNNAAITDLDKLVVFGEKITHLVGRKTDLNREMLEGMTAQEQSALFLQTFKMNQLVPEDLKLEEFHGYLDKMIHHNRITLEYSTQTYEGPVLLIKATDSTFVTSDFEGVPDYGWSNFAIANFGIEEVPGNHITLIRRPNVETVAQKLNQHIYRVLEATTVEVQSMDKETINK